MAREKMNDKPRLIDANALLNQFDPDSNERLHPIAIRMRIVQTPTITPTPQWTPVTERLPEIYKDKYGDLMPFLVCLKDTDYPFRAFFDGEKWGDGCSKLSVVAWMPLPEPYRMDGKDGE